MYISVFYIFFNIKRDNYKACFIIPAKVCVAQHLPVISVPLLADDRSFPLLKVGDFLHTPCHFDRSPPSRSMRGRRDIVEKSQIHQRFLDFAIWALHGMTKKIVLKQTRKLESIDYTLQTKDTLKKKSSKFTFRNYITILITITSKITI